MNHTPTTHSDARERTSMSTAGRPETATVIPPRAKPATRRVTITDEQAALLADLLQHHIEEKARQTILALKNLEGNMKADQLHDLIAQRAAEHKEMTALMEKLGAPNSVVIARIIT